MFKQILSTLFVALFVIVPLNLDAAIARDTYGSSGIASATSATVSLTLAGSDLTLIACGYVEGGNTISSATWNGTAMTEIDSVTISGRSLYGFYLTNPDTGTHNLVVNNSGTSAITVLGFSYTGTDSTQPDAYNTANEGSGITAQSINVTTVADNSWIVGCVVDDGGVGSATGSGAFTKLAVGTWNGTLLLDTNGAVTPAGSTAVGWTGGNSSTANAQMFAISVAPLVEVVEEVVNTQWW